MIKNKNKNKNKKSKKERKKKEKKDLKRQKKMRQKKKNEHFVNAKPSEEDSLILLLSPILITSENAHQNVQATDAQLRSVIGFTAYCVWSGEQLVSHEVSLTFF